jgi:hypothetical protein
MSIRKSNAFAGALLIVAAYLFVRGYGGIRHDGVLYAGEALARIVPGQFHQDLYFLFGSQGKFTVLPAFYSELIAAFGLGAGTMVGLLCAAILFLVASWLLVRHIAPSQLQFYCMLSVVLGWSLYGGRRVFAYAEPFLTARNFAEPAVLIALALLLSRRYALAAVALLLAAIFHPLIFAGGLGVAWLFMVAEDRRWLWCAPVGLIGLLSLGALQVGPFADLFQRYDPAWWDLVAEANPHALILQWAPLDLGIVVFDVVCIAFAIQASADRRIRGLLAAVLAIGVGSTVVSFVLVDLLHNVFFGKMQIWRALWILQWMSMATFPLAAFGLWKRDEAGRVIACLLGFGWIAPFSIAPALVAAIAVALNAARSRIAITRDLTRIVVGLLIAGACVIGVQAEMRAVKLADILDIPARTLVAQSLAVNVVVLGIVVGIWLLLPLRRWLALTASVVLFVAAAGLWDQRAGWTRTMESYATGQHIWEGLVEPDAKVYWYRDLMAPWILLGHGNYYTPQQGSGAVFSRDMMMELDRRRKVTALLDFQEQICRMMNGLNNKATSCEPDAEAVRNVCIDGQIDYVVLQNTLEGKKPLAEFSTSVLENGYERKFYLYRCSALKSGS